MVSKEIVGERRSLDPKVIFAELPSQDGAYDFLTE